MSNPPERRSGRDRRTSFLNGLERRQGSSQRSVPQCDASSTALDHTQKSSLRPGGAGSYWGAGEDVPPVE